MRRFRLFRRRALGFTLIEVMVALAIVAIALAAGTQASNALLHNAGRQTDILLAQICAENELAKVRLARQMPGVGESDFSCTQGGRVLGGSLSVAVTADPDFRRVEVNVRDGAVTSALHLLTLHTVVGRY